MADYSNVAMVWNQKRTRKQQHRMGESAMDVVINNYVRPSLKDGHKAVTRTLKVAADASAVRDAAADRYRKAMENPEAQDAWLAVSIANVLEAKAHKERREAYEAQEQAPHEAAKLVWLAKQKRILGSGKAMRTKRGGASAATAASTAQSAYSSKRVKAPPGMKFLGKTPTAEAYMDEKTGKIMFSIRGTNSGEDVANWGQVQLNNLANTGRYQRDKAFVETWLNRYPNATADISGHSLGGTIATQLKRDLPGRIEEARVFNPAVQPINDVFDKGDKVIRTVANNDPLYQYQGGKIASGQTNVINAGTGHSMDALAQQMGVTKRQEEDADPWANRGWMGKAAKGALGAVGYAAATASALTNNKAAGDISNMAYEKYYGGSSDSVRRKGLEAVRVHYDDALRKHKKKTDAEISAVERRRDRLQFGPPERVDTIEAGLNRQRTALEAHHTAFKSDVTNMDKALSGRGKSSKAKRRRGGAGEEERGW